MSLLSANVLASLENAGPDDQWPAVLSRQDDTRRAVEGQLDALPDAVVKTVLDHLASGDRHGPLWARAALWGVGLCHAHGAKVTGAPAPGLLQVQTNAGVDFALAPLAFGVKSTAGDERALELLISMLEAVILERRYTLHIKRPLPPGFDPEPIARAAQMWLSAVERGTEYGRCAAYEDDKVSVELCLTDVPRTPDKRGLLHIVGPKRSLERLARVDARLVHAAAASLETVPALPLVALLAADGPWKLSRGYVNQVLFGTPRQAFAALDGEETRYEAMYRANGLSLFSDDSCKHLSAVWWAEPDGDPLAVQAWTSENPWRPEGYDVPTLDGRRFWCREGPQGAGREVIMVQSKDELVRWRPGQ